ncbi:MAG: hypothetical protein B7Z55_04775 [Planctomycetales bacterium 12-60-4]|nr:MAG: hypothetical protein B7Z55_04775 [Planctomycetales bacterium 12-60-4]
MIFIGTTVVATWPLPKFCATAIPQGVETVVTVPLLNLWTVWWNADRAAAGLDHYWDAPIFAPATSTFVFSEAQPTTLSVAPLVWRLGNAILAYNTYLLVTLTLNGAMTYRLLRSRRFTRWSAVTGGVLMQTLPFVFWQLGVLQLTVLWPSLWTITAGLNLLELPRWRTACELGIAFGVTYASCNYYGLFLAVLVPPAAVWFLSRKWLKISSWGKLMLAAAIAVGLVFPIVQQQRMQSEKHEWSRDDDTINNLSAHTRDYIDTPYPQWLDVWEDVGSPRWNLWTLGSGWLKLITAGVGILVGLVLSVHRRWTLFAVTFALLAWWYSLGPQFDLWSISPYDLLRSFVPGFAQIRSPFRFAVFVQMAIIFLSANVIDALIRTTTSRRWNWWELVRWTLAVGCSIVFVAETRPALQILYFPPPSDPLPQWAEFLRDETPPESVVVCLPMVMGSTVVDYESETLWMYWSMFHHRRLINGYSGYFPKEYVAVKDALFNFPNDGVPLLLELKPDYAVVRRDFEVQSTIESFPVTSRWEWLFSDEMERIDIYRVQP